MGNAPSVDAADAARQIQSGDAKLIIDVRSPAEVAGGNYGPKAINIPLGNLSAALSLPADKFKKRFGVEKPKPSDTILFGCASGMRSSSATSQAVEMGFEKALNISGGYSAWMAAQR